MNRPAAYCVQVSTPLKQSKCFKVLERPPYNRSLSPCDFRISGPLKEAPIPAEIRRAAGCVQLVSTADYEIVWKRYPAVVDSKSGISKPYSNFVWLS
jgi:hypothetical protein